MSFDVDENGVYSYSNSFCKWDRSHKVTKHGYNYRFNNWGGVNIVLLKLKDIIVLSVVNIFKQNLLANMKIIVIVLMKLKNGQLRFVK